MKGKPYVVSKFLAALTANPSKQNHSSSFPISRPGQQPHFCWRLWPELTPLHRKFPPNWTVTSFKPFVKLRNSIITLGATNWATTWRERRGKLFAKGGAGKVVAICNKVSSSALLNIDDPSGASCPIELDAGACRKTIQPRESMNNWTVNFLLGIDKLTGLTIVNEINVYEMPRKFWNKYYSVFARNELTHKWVKRQMSDFN